MEMQQKRISAATVDSPDEGGEDTSEDTDSRSLNKSIESKSRMLPEPIIVTQQVEKEAGSSESTNSDLQDVLNCLRDPGDIKHLCHIRCPRLKKEECKKYKTAPNSNEDYGGELPYNIDYADYDLLEVKPVRIPLVHAKSCVHERESQSTIGEPPEPCNWCYCEDEGTSDEEAHYNDELNEKIRDPIDAGFLKMLPPKLAPINETGLIEMNDLPQGSDLQDVLNCVFPPRTFATNGQLWIQEVSPEPARRTEVIKLLEVLDIKIEEQQIKKSGVDPVRSSLYQQLFDELIRQETVVSPEIGLLLVRVRDEMKMTIAAWESILNQANNFALQHISKCEVRLTPLQKQLSKLTQELELAEQELSEFWDEQQLIKSEEYKKRDNVREDRKTELAPHQARNKLLKEQMRLLMNHEDDTTTHQSHLS